MARRTDPNQLSLFGELPESNAVRLAPTASELLSVRDQLSSSIRLGTSSWTFPGWKGILWDGAPSTSALARDGLSSYAKHPLLRTVGVDKTYYKPAPVEEFVRLRGQVTDDFRFLVKVHEAVTRPEPHHGGAKNHFLDCGYALDAVIDPVMQGLAISAGPILFQFSPMGVRSVKSAEAFIRKLGAFLCGLPLGPLYAVEARDRALMRPSWASMLKDSGAAHSYCVHPSMPSPAVQARTADPASQPAIVCRWMLHAGLAYTAAVDRYEPFDRIVDADTASRQEFAHLCALAIAHGKDAWVIINNKAEGSAPRSVELLARAVLAAGTPPRST